MANRGLIPDQVGGLPVLSAIGTPRAIGHTLGERLRARLQVAAQVLTERYATSLDGRVHVEPLHARLEPGLQQITSHQPALRMELDALAAAAEISAVEAFLIHAGAAAAIPQTAPEQTATVLLTERHVAASVPTMLFAWQVDPVVLQTLTLVRRLPAHAPASLSLTLGGLHPLAGLSEAGLGVVANPFIVTDSTAGLPLGHFVQAALAAPILDDAIARLAASPRLGGGAVHVLGLQDQRMSVELTGQRTVRLEDRRADVARLHTFHGLSSDISDVCPENERSTSELKRLAALVSHAISLTPENLAAWFGIGPSASPISGWDAARTVICVVEPALRRISVARGATDVATISL